MNKNPLLSVVIPVYNASQYINQCIDSVLASTYTNLEIILVDDGSTDNSGAICDEYAKSDNRIIVIHQENGGLSSARNTGLNAMHGDFVAFLDSDDWIQPDCYEKAMQMMIEHNLSCVHYSFKMVTHDHYKTIMKLRLSGKEYITDKKHVVDILLSGVRKYQFAWNAVYDAKLWQDVKFPVGRNWEDVATKYLAILNADKMIGFLPDYLLNYRYNPSGISQSFNIDSRYQLFLSYLDRYEFCVNSYPKLSDKCLSNAYAIALSVTHYKSKKGISNSDKTKLSECKEFIAKNRKRIFSSPKRLYGVVRLHLEIYYWLFRTIIAYYL